MPWDGNGTSGSAQIARDRARCTRCRRTPEPARGHVEAPREIHVAGALRRCLMHQKMMPTSEAAHKACTSVLFSVSIKASRRMRRWRCGFLVIFAKVAELADAPDLGSGGRKALGVRLPPFAPAFARAYATDYARRAAQLCAYARQARGTCLAGSRSAAREADLSAVAATDGRRTYNSMKTEFADLTETQERARRNSQRHRRCANRSRRAELQPPGAHSRIPAGKVPPTLIKKRFREQILHDVAHD